MMWVKDTFPPRERFRWLLMTTRLSMSSLAGMARTLVAVGTCSDDSMLLTTRALAPRSGLTSFSLSGPVAFGAGASRGVGASLGGAVAAGVSLACAGVAVAGPSTFSAGWAGFSVGWPAFSAGWAGDSVAGSALGLAAGAGVAGAAGGAGVAAAFRAGAEEDWAAGRPP